MHAQPIHPYLRYDVFGRIISYPGNIGLAAIFKPLRRLGRYLYTLGVQKIQYDRNCIPFPHLTWPFLSFKCPARV
jgi:hypothetical protein